MIQVCPNRTLCNVLLRLIDSEMTRDIMRCFCGWVNPGKMWIGSSWQPPTHKELENKTNVEEGRVQDRESGF